MKTDTRLLLVWLCCGTLWYFALTKQTVLGDWEAGDSVSPPHPSENGKRSMKCSYSMNSILWTKDRLWYICAGAFSAQLHNCEIAALDLESLPWINMDNSSPRAPTLLIYDFKMFVGSRGSFFRWFTAVKNKQKKHKYNTRKIHWKAFA